jgi:hypothetical protein
VKETEGQRKVMEEMENDGASMGKEAQMKGNEGNDPLRQGLQPLHAPQ